MQDNAQPIHLNITFRNTDATEPLKNYAHEKIGHCLEKFAHKETEVHVVLRVEKNRQVAEVSTYVDGATIVAKEESDNLYAAIDAVTDSLTQQLRKHKEKLTSHH